MSGSTGGLGWRVRLAQLLSPADEAVKGHALRVASSPAPADGLLYARGFLLAKGPPPGELAHWHAHRVADYTLHVDPRIRTEVASVGGRRAWLLGDAFDPEAGVYQDVLPHLLSGNLLERLDSLAGRFVVFVEEGGRLEVYHDAMGMRSVFHGAGVVASHAALVAQMADAPLREWVMPFITSRGYLKRDVKYLPGLDSPFEGISQLTPNTRLVLPGFGVERYWPREPNAQGDRGIAVEALVTHLAGLRRYLEANAIKPVLGVSAGRDSRCVLAALAPLSPRLFTFVRSEGGKSVVSEDSRTARELAERGGLQLEVVKVAAPSTLDEAARPFGVMFRRNTGFVRGPTSTWVEHFVGDGDDDPLFVRGFGGEVMRGFYRTMKARDVASMANTYDVNAGSGYTRNAFERFARLTGWDTADFHGYEPNDIFYWEHRMGTWGSSALLESDMAFRTAPGYNSRTLFKAFMGLPPEHRTTSDVFDEATRTLLPAFAGVPYSS